MAALPPEGSHCIITIDTISPVAALFSVADTSRGSVHGYNFTERVPKVLALAREEAMRLRHEYVAPEHLLLAILREGSGTAAKMLARRGVDLRALKQRIEETVKLGGARPHSGPDLPYTSSAKKVLELAMKEARELDHDHVGTGHLLLGLISEGRAIAAHVLAETGVTLEQCRRDLQGSHDAAEQAAPPGAHARFQFSIDEKSNRSIYEQIVAQVQEGVAMGRLTPGDRLPAVRQLADELDIAPGTVARAYAELERLGIVITEGARGTRIAPRSARQGGSSGDPPETLVGLLRPVVVAAFHLGASDEALRSALERAMSDIFGRGGRDAA